jgi:SH3-like domain-containing protein
MNIKKFIFLAFALSLFSAPVSGEKNLPVPRFASLRSAEVNVRVGPGKHYPVEWTFVRAHMPVEIIAEFYTWRKIQDWQGSGGWVHQSMLSGTRTGIVTDKERLCRNDDRGDAAPLVRLEPGVMVKISKCKGSWCKIQVDGYKCWVERSDIWGVYPNEKVD